MKHSYIEPEFNVIQTNTDDIITTSIGGEDFNMMGDLANRIFYKNSSWTIEL